MQGRTQPESNAGEQGYMLLAMVLMVTLVLIALSVAAPVIARDLQRDKEVESMHRAQQYVRGLRLYYRKFKSYPPSMDALEKSNNVRYLRKQYIDPLTGKADWRIIHVGENQTTVKGFFGEPLGGINSTGIGGSGLGSASGMSSGVDECTGGGLFDIRWHWHVRGTSATSAFGGFREPRTSTSGPGATGTDLAAIRHLAARGPGTGTGGGTGQFVGNVFGVWVGWRWTDYGRGEREVGRLDFDAEPTSFL